MMKTLFMEGAYTPRERLLVNGEMVIFRLLERSYEPALRAFFLDVPENEARTLRDDVHDPAVISFWMETLDYGRVLPLIALSEHSEHIVGVSSLHFMQGVNRHVADVRIVVGRSYRKLGLGSAMVKELVQIGNELGLHFIKAEILVQNKLAIKAFRQLGFENKCVLDDYFITRQGETHDVVFMLKRLFVNMEEDFFFVF